MAAAVTQRDDYTTVKTINTAITVALVATISAATSHADQLRSAVICAGAAALNDGSIITLGQPFVGTMKGSDSPLGMIVGFAGHIRRTDLPPLAVDDALVRPAAGSYQFPVTTLLANDRDPSGLALVVSEVSPTSAHGGFVSLAGDLIRYSPPAAGAELDSFSYTVRNTGGLSASATVTLNTLLLRLIDFEDSAGARRFRFNTIPGLKCTVEASNDLIVWTTLGIATANAIGWYEIMDPHSLANARFYRAVVVP